MHTKKEIAAQVRADYDAVVGKIVLLDEVECYDDAGNSETVGCVPPAVGRIDAYDEQQIRSDLVRWTDEGQCDPYLNVTIVAPHPAFADVRPSWVYGRTRNVNGTVEEPTFALADESMQEQYRDAPALDHETTGGCAPGAAPFTP